MNKSDGGAAQEVAVVVDDSRQQDLIIAGQGHEVPQQPKLPETETELIDGGGEGMNKSEQDSVHGGDDEYGEQNGLQLRRPRSRWLLVSSSTMK